MRLCVRPAALCGSAHPPPPHRHPVQVRLRPRRHGRPPPSSSGRRRAHHGTASRSRTGRGRSRTCPSSCRACLSPVSAGRFPPRGPRPSCQAWPRAGTSSHAVLGSLPPTWPAPRAGGRSLTCGSPRFAGIVINKPMARHPNWPLWGPECIRFRVWTQVPRRGSLTGVYNQKLPSYGC